MYVSYCWANWISVRDGETIKVIRTGQLVWLVRSMIFHDTTFLYFKHSLYEDFDRDARGKGNLKDLGGLRDFLFESFLFTVSPCVRFARCVIAKKVSLLFSNKHCPPVETDHVQRGRALYIFEGTITIPRGLPTMPTRRSFWPAR